MKNALRVAVAGAGFAGGLHLAGWKRVPNAEVVAICDPAIEKAEARAREFGVASVFRDAEKIAAYNPLRKVPTLVLDGGLVLSETFVCLDVLRRVKHALDPAGIMNPGKLGLGPEPPT